MTLQTIGFSGLPVEKAISIKFPVVYNSDNCKLYRDGSNCYYKSLEIVELIQSRLKYIVKLNKSIDNHSTL
jgi:hypothetical protein